MNDQKVRKLFAKNKHLVEAAADFSNGNTHQGMDEGDRIGWDMWHDYMTEAIKLGLLDEPLIPIEDPRVNEVIKVAEANCSLAFNEIVGFEKGEFTDKFLGETIPCTTYVLSFVDPGGTFVTGELLMLDGSFSIRSANYCAGWLVFPDKELPEIRFIRNSDEAIVFTGVYTREQLVRGLIDE